MNQSCVIGGWRVSSFCLHSVKEFPRCMLITTRDETIKHQYFQLLNYTVIHTAIEE